MVIKEQTVVFYNSLGIEILRRTIQMPLFPI